MRVPAWWNWRVSAHCRVASLASAWVLTIPLGLPGPAWLALIGLRTCASGAQSWLNVGLGRRDPVGNATALDWALIVAIFAGAEYAAVVNAATGAEFGPGVLWPAMCAFSLLQVRLAARSYRGHGRAVRRDAALIRLDRFGARQAVQPPAQDRTRRAA